MKLRTQNKDAENLYLCTDLWENANQFEQIIELFESSLKGKKE